MRKTRIEQLEVGDRVVIDTSSSYDRYVVGEVTRVTATQIAVGNVRYNKRTGIRMGDADSYSLRRQIAQDWKTGQLMSIEEAKRRNKEADEELRAKLLAVKIKDVPLGKLKGLPIETLQEVARLLGLEE